MMVSTAGACSACSIAVQGGCERIKKTPMPRGYSFIAERLVLFFSVTNRARRTWGSLAPLETTLPRHGGTLSYLCTVRDSGKRRDLAGCEKRGRWHSDC